MEELIVITSIKNIISLKVFSFTLNIEPFLDQSFRPWKLQQAQQQQHSKQCQNKTEHNTQTQKQEQMQMNLMSLITTLQTLLFFKLSSLIVGTTSYSFCFWINNKRTKLIPLLKLKKKKRESTILKKQNKP